MASVVVCEWLADVDLAAAPIEAASATRPAAARFVDFDAMETVHVSTVSPGRL